MDARSEHDDDKEEEDQTRASHSFGQTNRRSTDANDAVLSERVDDGDDEAKRHPRSTMATVNDVDRVRVVVRLRPGQGRRGAEADGTTVRVRERRRGRRAQAMRNDSESEGERSQTVAFRGPCAGETVTQDAFFDVCGVKMLLDRAMEGYASAVFAYGQTGSGKTYTMLGRAGKRGESESTARANDVNVDAVDGIIGRSIAYMFQRDETLALRVTHYEIYQDNIIDLLDSESTQPLHVRWCKHEGFYVPNLSSRECFGASETVKCVREGAARRQVRSHKLNAESSRSHAVLTVNISRRKSNDTDDAGDRYDDENEDGKSSSSATTTTTHQSLGKITFVDLAGSERLKHSGSRDKGTYETGLINRSLFALGKVISTLADEARDPRSVASHVPYRDSKLTKLLMDSLGGRSLTLMIACCSSNADHVEETIRTLQYAARVTSIVNTPPDLEDIQSGPCSEDDYKRAIVSLKSENKTLRRRIASLSRSGSEKNPSTPSSSPYDALATSDTPNRYRRFSNSVYHTSNVISRVSKVESLLRMYADENRHLERENETLRGEHQCLTLELGAALREVENFKSIVHRLESVFLGA